jgi:flagellar hook assembly protein FlgD
MGAARAFCGAASLLLGLSSRLFAQGQVQLFIDQSFVAKDSGAYCYYNAAQKHFFCLDGTNNCSGGAYCQDIDALDASGMQPQYGNISNDPRIEFDQRTVAETSALCRSNVPPGDDDVATGTGLGNNTCNADVFICAGIGYNNPGSDAVALDMVSFEIFKFQDGANPLDAGSTPPLRTFFVDSPGVLDGASNSTVDGDKGPYCILWDGAYPIQGELGKTNGQYGFRVTAQTNQTGSSGNITITAQRAYPSGATMNVDGEFVLQKPILVDVTNVHVVRSSPTVVGAAGVYAQPYNLTYRLSKDASMYITITDPGTGGVLRTVLPGVARVGEGTPNGTLLNGDAWNGRGDNGALLPPGVFLATLQAYAADQFGGDLSYPTTRQISLDPLQITDIRVQPLLGGATSLATLSYVLTEPATVYIDIYPPNTQFCGNLNNVNDPINSDIAIPGLPPKNFRPYVGACPAQGGTTPAPLVRHIEEFKISRSSVLNYWDGRDSEGNALCQDGDYVFAIYASLPSMNGSVFNGNAADRRIWTTKAQTGFIPVIRGFVGLSQVAPSPTVIGSSPAISGLNPFIFRYSLGRDAITSMKIFDHTGTRLVRTLADNVVRPGLFANQEIWSDPVDNTGRWVTSGTYIAQLTAGDPLCPMRVSTVSASFPVDLFRITDVQTTPLMSGASDTVTLNYQLSQSMNVVWNIYPPGTVILNSTSTWPPCGMTMTSCANTVSAQGAPVGPMISFHGTRPGRMRITEYWDGRDANGLLVPDGSYVFTLVAQSTTTPQYYATDRIFGTLTVSRGAIIFTTFSVQPTIPELYNSSATITLHPFSIHYALTRQSSVTIQILNNNLPNQVIRTLFAGAVRDGGLLLEDVWDGRDDRGNFPPSGFYLVRAVAQDVASLLTSPSTAQMTISYDPLRIYDVAIAPLVSSAEGARILYQVSETMKVAVKIYRPGTVFDGNGNPTPPEPVSLVKRIVGVRPARTQIEEVWDGLDLRQSGSIDGNYKFTIVASTDMSAIDTKTGNVLNAQALAVDRPLDDIAVVRNLSEDPQGEFERFTYVYPNPVDGDTAHLVIYTPFQANAKLKLFTMSGDLVLDKDFGEQAANTYVDGGSTHNGVSCFTWNRSNSAGRRVARGVYYALIRLEATDGSRNILQKVKKFLVR